MKYDNSNSGALFATGDATILSGPFQFTEKEPAHIAVMQLGADGVHTLAVHKRGKEGQAVGKALATGEIRRTTTNGAPNQNGNPTPVARGVLVGSALKGKELKVCIWKAARKDATGDFYQVKPDSFEPRSLPAL